MSSEHPHHSPSTTSATKPSANTAPAKTAAAEAATAKAADGTERREYFRVEDRALLRYCLVKPEAVGGTPANNLFDDGELFWLLRELRNIDRENHNVLRALAEQNRELGGYLRTVNRKIELLASAVLALDPNRANMRPQEISLSEGGLSFLADPKLAIGTTLALELTLLPEQVGIVCYGEVIANRDEPPARSVIQFLQMGDADRQQIARHIFQVQIAARRLQNSSDE